MSRHGKPSGACASVAIAGVLRFLSSDANLGANRHSSEAHHSKRRLADTLAVSVTIVWRVSAIISRRISAVVTVSRPVALRI